MLHRLHLPARAAGEHAAVFEHLAVSGIMLVLQPSGPLYLSKSCSAVLPALLKASLPCWTVSLADSLRPSAPLLAVSAVERALSEAPAAPSPTCLQMAGSIYAAASQLQLHAPFQAAAGPHGLQPVSIAYEPVELPAQRRQACGMADLPMTWAHLLPLH